MRIPLKAIGDSEYDAVSKVKEGIAAMWPESWTGMVVMPSVEPRRVEVPSISTASESTRPQARNTRIAMSVTSRRGIGRSSCVIT